MLCRNVLFRAEEALSDTPVVLLQGARQTGKTTLAQTLAREGAQRHRYLTLDDAGVLSAARESPAGFIAGLEGPVVLDEVQFAPELFPAIKAAVEQDRTPGRFLLTGSANVLLLPKLSESLAGRMELLHLWPFSQGELGGSIDSFIDQAFARKKIRWRSLPLESGARDIWSRVQRGGYPEVQTRASARRRSAWFGSYVTTILQRDIREITNIEGLGSLPRLLELLAARTGGLLNYSELSRSLSIPQTSLKRYISLLEATFLVRLLPPWSSNLGKRLVKSPKVFLLDTGLASSLLGLEDADAVPGSRASGGLLENFVVMELTKQATWSETSAKLFHYRTPSGLEVDIVLETPFGELVGVEVKSRASVSASDFRGLRSLQDTVGDRFVRGVVLYSGNEVVPFDTHLHAVPISCLWRPPIQDA